MTNNQANDRRSSFNWHAQESHEDEVLTVCIGRAATPFTKADFQDAISLVPFYLTPTKVYSTWDFTQGLLITHLEHLHNGWFALLERQGNLGLREVFHGQLCT